MLTKVTVIKFLTPVGRSSHEGPDDGHHQDRVRVQGHRLQHVRRRRTEGREKKGKDMFIQGALTEGESSVQLTS